jgi:hypothetical protein
MAIVTGGLRDWGCRSPARSGSMVHWHWSRASRAKHTDLGDVPEMRGAQVDHRAIEDLLESKSSASRSPEAKKISPAVR